MVCRVFKKKNLFKIGSEGVSTHNHQEQQQMNINISSGTNPRSFMHRENQYLLHHQQQQNHSAGFEHEKPELSLHYQHLQQNSQYSSLFQSQSLLHAQKPLEVNFDYSYASSSLHSEQPITVKQLMTNPRDCESGSDGLRYQVSESGIEVGSCEPPRSGGDGMNEWGMLDRLVNEDSTKLGGSRFEDANNHQINQLSLRGEMDIWGYGKQ